MPSVDLPQGTIHYRVAGPEAAAKPVVFVHGFLTNGELWTGVAERLAEQGVRSYAPDWPLGSHTTALPPDADLSPRGVARLVLAFLEALDLQDVTLVGNDSGGAISQFVIDTDDSRIGRLVLTNCDAFDKFPPAPFDMLLKRLRNPIVLRTLLAPLNLKALRHSPAGFGLLVNKPLDPELTARWVEPARKSAAIRNDIVKFCRGIDPQELLAISTRLDRFTKPVLLTWGAGDTMFKIEFARRLRDIFPDARLVEIPGGKTFIPLDEPERVADEIVAAFNRTPH